MSNEEQQRKSQLEVAPMSSTRQLHAARMLLHAQREWLASLGVPSTGDGPAGTTADFEDPARFYNRTGGVLLIARLDGRAIGMVGLRRLARWPHTAEIRRLFVTSSARGQGAGRKLVEAALDHAFRMGYEEVVLETMPEKMASASRIYRALGFEKMPSTKAEPLPGQIGMRRELRQRQAGRVRLLPQRRLATATATAH
jgi:ribosomal protein S18 acetylase RimI-like enzyme